MYVWPASNAQEVLLFLPSVIKGSFLIEMTSTEGEERIHQAEALKNTGNALYAKHMPADAAAKYSEAIKLLDGAPQTESVKTALALLHSNLSQVLFELKRYEESREESAAATRYDATLVKAWFRNARANLALGFSFLAYIIMQRHLLPCVNQAGLPVKDLAGLDDSIHSAIGLDEVDRRFAVVPYAGGLGTCASAAIPSDAVLFVEKHLDFEVRDEIGGGDATTERLVVNFSNQLLALCKDIDMAGPNADALVLSRWDGISKKMFGSWPRKMEEIPTDVLHNVQELLDQEYGTKLSKPVAAQMMLLSLQCRYNCFHTGFFRVCALINHSCMPNAAMKYRAATGCVTLVTCKDIAAGESIAVKYLSDFDFLLGAGRRRELLFHSWLFWCDCTRCKEELDATSTSEMIVCKVCGEYVHLPTPSGATSELAIEAAGHSKDPLMVSQRACGKCNTMREWAQEEVRTVVDVRSDAILQLYEVQQEQQKMEMLPKTFASCASTLKGACAKSGYMLRRISSLVHREHWIYRTVLYVMCVSVQESLNFCLQSTMTNCTIESFLQVLPVIFPGMTDDVPENELVCHDMLRGFVGLWDRIRGFYPAAQAWLLHVAIARLLVFHIIGASLQKEVPPFSKHFLPYEKGHELLQLHCKLACGEAAPALRMLQALQPHTTLSAKQVKDLKKTLHA